MSSYKVLLLDIEGTITSISFVKDELFPYAYKNVDSFLEQNFDSGDVKKVVAELKELSAQEAANDSEIRQVREEKSEAICDIAHNVRRWIDLDKKLTPMKTLQGLIWENAYKTGAVKGHLYPDVVPVLRQKVASGIKVFIYSSGSVYAQKLLFGHSVEGDITDILSGYFDTKVGLKGESQSYTKIASEINTEPSDILFLTDVFAEAEAASSAGLQTKILLRPGNAPLPAEAAKFEHISDLNSI